MENCLAIFVTLFNADSNDYAYDLGGIGHFYRDYLRLMEHWRNQVSEPMLEVDYESLVTNQEEESRRIIDFIGLDWDHRCLEFYNTERSIRTASSWQVRQPIYKESLQRWKHYEKYLAPLKQALEA